MNSRSTTCRELLMSTSCPRSFARSGPPLNEQLMVPFSFVTMEIYQPRCRPISPVNCGRQSICSAHSLLVLERSRLRSQVVTTLDYVRLICTFQGLRQWARAATSLTGSSPCTLLGSVERIFDFHSPAWAPQRISSRPPFLQTG